MLGQDFQVDRIIKQLLLIEDHLNAVIEGTKYKVICVECLSEKHFPLVEGLCIECIDGVCTVNKLKETCENIVKTIHDLHEALYNNFNKEIAREFAEKIRTLRKQITDIQKSKEFIDVQ